MISLNDCFAQFFGEGGSGKSFQIARAVKSVEADRCVISIRVNEGFTLEGMVERLSSHGEGSLIPALARGRPLTFVFHVSAYAPFPEFDSFLFQWFVGKLHWLSFVCHPTVSLYVRNIDVMQVAALRAENLARWCICRARQMFKSCWRFLTLFPHTTKLRISGRRYGLVDWVRT